MSDKYFTAQVWNTTRETIRSYWINHKPESGSTHNDWGYGTNLSSESMGAEFKIKIVPGTSDVWTVNWVDERNNLFVSEHNFDATVRLSEESVVVKIEKTEVEIRQKDDDGDREAGNSGFVQLGAGINTSG